MHNNFTRLISVLILGGILSLLHQCNPANAQTSPTSLRSDSAAVPGSLSDYYKRSDVKDAIRKFDQARQLLIDEARRHFTRGEYADAVLNYQKAEDTVPEMPPPPGGPYPKIKVRLVREYAEWGEALAAQGKITEAIETYRKMVYRQRRLGEWQPSDELTSMALLPNGSTSLADARERFKDAVVSVWLCNQSGVLARYAQLLVETKQYEEAIRVYDWALRNLNGSPYEAALHLDNLSAQNFDRSRFSTALHVLLALDGESVLWYGYYTLDEFRDARIPELQKALKVKPDYAPALVALADCLEMRGDVESKRLAEEYKAKAELSARGEAQRELVRIRSGKRKISLQ